MVELTASKKTSSTAAYRVNVLNCTRESARGERIGRSQYGHRIVAVFNSLAYPFSSKIPLNNEKKGPFSGVRGLSNFLKFQYALLDFTYSTLFIFISWKCCSSRVFIRWHVR